MRVNEEKTFLMCFGVDSSVNLRAEIKGSDGSVIQSVETAKLLGFFHFDQKMSADKHVEELLKKANKCI